MLFLSYTMQVKYLCYSTRGLSPPQTLIHRHLCNQRGDKSAGHGIEPQGKGNKMFLFKFILF